MDFGAAYLFVFKLMTIPLYMSLRLVLMADERQIYASLVILPAPGRKISKNLHKSLEL